MASTSPPTEADKENVSKLNTSVSELSIEGDGKNGGNSNVANGACIDDISVEKMEDIVFEWLRDAEDIAVYTTKFVRNKLEKHLNLAPKALRKNKKFKQATKNVCIQTFCSRIRNFAICYFCLKQQTRTKKMNILARTFLIGRQQIR